MTRLFVLICLMTMVSSLGMGVENDWVNHPDFPRALDRFRQVVITIKRLEDNPNRNSAEEKQFQDACNGLHWRKLTVIFCGIDDDPGPENFDLNSRRIDALNEILNHIMYREFRLTGDYR